MAFFLYKDIKKNRNKPGVCLRVNAMLKDPAFVEVFGRFNIPREHLEWIKVHEVESGWARLQCWTASFRRKMKFARSVKGIAGHIASRKPYMGDSHVVVAVVMPENPEWICESDMGRGYAEGRR